MKSLFSIALLILALFGNAEAFAAMKGTMSGKDATHGSGGEGEGSCSAAISRCNQHYGAAKCSSAGAACMRTGVFTSPAGKSYPGLQKN
jgi:hypothetical protein